MKILVIHGPNLQLLGTREPGIYGKTTLAQINAELKAIARRHKITLVIKQSNQEGEIVDLIGKGKKIFAGLLINPAAYTHTSVAIRDSISATSLPTIEVHLFGFKGNLYGKDIEVEFVKKIRPERKFRSKEALIKQIRSDAALAQKIL